MILRVTHSPLPLVVFLTKLRDQVMPPHEVTRSLKHRDLVNKGTRIASMV
jgi:hypothetical protein